MYSWGGGTGGWKGGGSYDYGSARAGYDKIAKAAGSRKSYSAISSPDMGLVDPRGKTIESKSENPIIVGIDVTGSMNVWPREIFDRLPLLYQTLAKYRPDVEFCFSAIGDATSDQYPLQVNDFGKAADLEKKLQALYPEGGGGGQIKESYELFGHFISEHCQTPNAKSPFLIIYGDEAFYDTIQRNQVKHFIGDDIAKTVDSKEMWQKLMQRFNVYFLQKPYGGGENDGTTGEVGRIWKGALGDQRVIPMEYEIKKEDGSMMPGYERAVDIAMGLIAKSWGEYGDFKDSLDARHDDKSVKKSVHTSLRHIPDKLATASVTGSKKTKLSKPFV